MLPDWVGPEAPALAERSADPGTSLSQSLGQIAKREDEESWSRSVNPIDRILAVKADLFDSLLEKLPE